MTPSWFLVSSFACQEVNYRAIAHSVLPGNEIGKRG